MACGGPRTPGLAREAFPGGHRTGLSPGHAALGVPAKNAVACLSLLSYTRSTERPDARELQPPTAPSPPWTLNGPVLFPSLLS